MTILNIKGAIAWRINDAAYALLRAAGRLDPDAGTPDLDEERAVGYRMGVRRGRREALQGLS